MSFTSRPLYRWGNGLRCSLKGGLVEPRLCVDVTESSLGSADNRIPIYQTSSLQTSSYIPTAQLSSIQQSFFFILGRQPPMGKGLLIQEVSRSHTTTRHSRQDSSGRVIGSSQGPLPDNTRHSQQTDIHAPAGIRTHNLSWRAAVDLCLRPRSHWDRPQQSLLVLIQIKHIDANGNQADIFGSFIHFPL